MTDEKPGSTSETPKPDSDKEQAGFKKVDTEVQEEAAKEREDSGGYD